MATSRATLRAEAARLIGALVWSGTASGGSTTTLIDSGPTTTSGSLIDTGMSAYLFGGCYVYMTGGTAANIGQWRMITPSGYAPTTGTLTLGAALSAAIAASDTYEIYAFLDPDQWTQIINDALGKMTRHYRSPITLIRDGDFESSGTSDFTQIGTCTLTKDTTLDVVSGAQSLKTVNGAADSGASSDG